MPPQKGYVKKRESFGLLLLGSGPYFYPRLRVQTIFFAFRFEGSQFKIIQ